MSASARMVRFLLVNGHALFYAIYMTAPACASNQCKIQCKDQAATLCGNMQAADSNGTLHESRPSNTGRGGPPSTSSDTGLALDLDADSPYISMRSSRQNSMQDNGPASKDMDLEASVLDTLTDSVLTGATCSSEHSFSPICMMHIPAVDSG